MAISPQRILPSSRVAIFVLLLLYPCWSGCVGIPQGPSIFRKPPPAYKTQYKTPTARVAELQQLAAQAANLSAEEQRNVCGNLQQDYAATSDPILRREIVKTLGAMSDEAANVGLHRAAEADDPLVRMASVAGWSRRRGPEAEAALGSLLANDANVDVRLAAARALAGFSTPGAGQYLAQVLKDRNPAVQLAAMQSLRSVTGLDLGNDVNQWIAHAATAPSSAGDANRLPQTARPTTGTPVQR